MKKFLAIVSALCLSFNTAYAAPDQSGTAVGGLLRGHNDQEGALPTVTFNCLDERMGNFDVCIDVLFSILQVRDIQIVMDANLGSKFKQKAPKVLLRYTFRKLPTNQMNNLVFVSTYDRHGVKLSRDGVAVRSSLIVRRASLDGGDTWYGVERDWSQNN